IFNAMDASGFAQTLERFFEGLVTQTKTAVMHRHQRFRSEFIERAHRFFRIHVDFARKRRIVGADRQKRDLDIVALADFFESLEISRVAAVKNTTLVCADDKAAKAAMCISQKARAPMVSRG